MRAFCIGGLGARLATGSLVQASRAVEVQAMASVRRNCSVS